MDFKSWPGGKAKGEGNPKLWKKCLDAYGLTEEQALAYTKNPIDNLAPLVKAGVPIIHVVGDKDVIVPVDENTAIAKNRYQSLGGIFEVIHKKEVGHHPHSLKDPSQIVDFIVKHNKGVSAKKNGHVPVSSNNFHMRGNYNNCRAVFEQTKRGHVAFLGGSITEMNGYRPMMCEFLKKQFPQTDFTFTNAGISSTCSDTGVFRLERDVLSKGSVDLLFVEFSVNDDQDGVYSQKRAVRGMEGIIAQVRRHNPKSDIIMTHFVNEKMLAALRAGKAHGSHDAHAAVAVHHNIANNDLAQELADQVNAGTMDWKRFGGVHPNKTGNGMCASMIKNALLKEWSRPLAAKFKPIDHSMVELKDAMSYLRGRFIPLSDIEMDDAWVVAVPKWKEVGGRVRGRFKESTMIHSSTIGAKLKVSFKGTAIGAYVLSGPDTGILRCSIDGKSPVDIDPIHKYSGFHYPQTIMLFDDLEYVNHVMTLELIDNKPGRLRKGGTAFRALHFTAN
ncbi:MAG: SGNH/GDSL hydrolase family protein [Planctomycetes bacterium]|nr:SGNH/GDSL hydrolase family protein [Planctomycetota bacterium]